MRGWHFGLIPAQVRLQTSRTDNHNAVPDPSTQLGHGVICLILMKNLCKPINSKPQHHPNSVQGLSMFEAAQGRHQVNNPSFAFSDSSVCMRSVMWPNTCAAQACTHVFSSKCSLRRGAESNFLTPSPKSNVKHLTGPYEFFLLSNLDLTRRSHRRLQVVCLRCPSSYSYLVREPPTLTRPPTATHPLC